MDEVCSAVLQTVGSQGTYKIISEQEFFEAFPEKSEKTRKALLKAFDTLSGEGYIDIKYSSGSMYCIAALKKEIAPVICADEPRIEEVYEETGKRSLPVFWAAFLGGAAGSLLISLIFAFI